MLRTAVTVPFLIRGFDWSSSWLIVTTGVAVSRSTLYLLVIDAGCADPPGMMRAAGTVMVCLWNSAVSTRSVSTPLNPAGKSRLKREIEGPGDLIQVGCLPLLRNGEAGELRR